MLASLLVAFAPWFAASAQAQATSQTVALVVPYPPGGTADALARMLAVPMGLALGQPVIIDNRPGAAGTLAAAHVARAKPDGRTLLFTNAGPSAIAPAMNKNVSYDPEKDFTAISLVARSPLLLVVNGASEIKDLQGLIAYARARPDAMAYSSPGIGSFTHLATERLAQAAGIKLLHVPYKGQAPAVTAVISGEVQMMLSSSSGAMSEMIRNGRLRLIGVSTAEPTPLAPGAPPIRQVPPGYETDFWFGIVAPAQTPAAAVQRLHAAVQKAMGDPGVPAQLEATASERATGPSDEFQRYLATEARRWRDVVVNAKIEPDK